jgi:hypothetical protein
MMESNFEISGGPRNITTTKKLAKGPKHCDEKECKEESEKIICNRTSVIRRSAF